MKSERGESSLKSREFEVAFLAKKAEEIHSSGPDEFVELLRSALNKGALFRFRAKGFSMSPFLRDDDVITVSPLWHRILRVGDVVAFVSPRTRRLMVHRVVAKRGNSYSIRGDHAPVSDGLIPSVHILGRVTRVEREGKRVFVGFGPERFLIAFAARMGLFSNFLLPIWRWIRQVFLTSDKGGDD